MIDLLELLKYVKEQFNKFLEIFKNFYHELRDNLGIIKTEEETTAA